MTRLDQYRALAQSQLKANADLLYRHTATWSDGTTCRFSVQDPNKGNDVRTAAINPDVASLRVLKIHPDDSAPEVSASTPWEGGTLTRGANSDTSDFTGQAAYACRLADGRYYPQTATAAGMAVFNLRIEAQAGQALQAGSGAMDVQAITTNSHRGYLPPGVRLDQGDDLTTDQGERFRVLDPIRRDVLGDTVGLSREGTGVW
ncbi:hypothetical protein [Deinococcus altitudinis]|uniref:hypothetical protein n=1 Tax=Deinococcus altitudinis TaxID=468914 RepID=UPI003892C69D